MPYKINEPHRGKFKKTRCRIDHWPEYNEALRQRGDITLWFSDEMVANGHPTMTGSRGRPQEYSAIAIECCLMLRQVYRLPLRQTQGLVRSLITMMSLAIIAPDYTTLSKRSVLLA